MSMHMKRLAATIATLLVTSAVALSWNGQHLAWIATHGAQSELMIGSRTAGNARAVALPDHCTPTGLRWQPRWTTLAVVATCDGNTASAHSDIWKVGTGRDAQPQRVASLDGLAHDLQWSPDGKAIAFLFTPAATAATAAPTQLVASVSAGGGKPQAATPANWNVQAFHLAARGHAITFTATPAGTPPAAAPNLYLQAGPRPELLFDPATATAALHGLRASLPRFGANGTHVYFLGQAPGNAAKNLYNVRLADHAVSNMTANLTDKPVWFTVRLNPGMDHGTLVATQAGRGQVQFVSYRRHDEQLISANQWFSLPGVIGNGRAPFGVSFSGFGGRMAFAQRTADGVTVIRAGGAPSQPPPIVAQATPQVAMTAH